MMCWMAFPGSAAECKQEIIQFEDGSYAIVEVTTSGARAAKSVNGSKQYTYCDSDGVAQWKAVLNGSFTCSGSTATCTSSSCSITIYVSDWYTISKSARIASPKLNITSPLFLSAYLKKKNGFS